MSLLDDPKHNPIRASFLALLLHAAKDAATELLRDHVEHVRAEDGRPGDSLELH